MKRIVSGITPSGDGSLHIGNYLGAVKQFIELSKTYDCFLFVADYHALTTIQNKNQLEKNIGNLILNELSLLAGFSDMSNITFYRQSDIPFHTELQTILNNVTPLGLIKRAHAYKDKLGKDVMEDDINMGLFNYPVLMASDILLYKADAVPVGKDQKQHIEITRDIAHKFNTIYKTQVLREPEAMIEEATAVVLGTDGKRKMSKSLGNYIGIFDDEETIRKQVMSCYTDPTRAHADDPGHIEGNMVFTYLDFFGDKTRVSELKAGYEKGTVSDVAVKEELVNVLLTFFAPARKKYEEFQKNPELMKDILRQGTKKATKDATVMMEKVRKTIGVENTFSVGGDNGTISINDFAKVEIRVGKVIEAVDSEGSDKLIRLTVDFVSEKRTIFTGVRQYGYSAVDFQGKQFLFVTNLEPKKMMNEESQGMILAVDDLELPMGVHGDVKPLFITGEGLPVGARVR